MYCSKYIIWKLRNSDNAPSSINYPNTRTEVAVAVTFDEVLVSSIQTKVTISSSISYNVFIGWHSLWAPLGIQMSQLVGLAGKVRDQICCLSWKLNVSTLNRCFSQRVLQSHYRWRLGSTVIFHKVVMDHSLRRGNRSKTVYRSIPLRFSVVAVSPSPFISSWSEIGV